MHSSRLALLITTTLASAPAWAAPIVDSAGCKAPIAQYEQEYHLPAQMLGAIGVVESGRLDRSTGAASPWPWTIDVAGTPHVFASASDAIQAVRDAQSAGQQSIDIGCMQINLAYHPHAFPTLEEAFDPASNVRYAASFLTRLRSQTGSWAGAVAAYHSATPALGARYAGLVARVWPLAARYGLSQSIPGPNLDPGPDPIDPTHLLTPEFRAELEASAAFQAAQDRKLGLHTARQPAPPPPDGCGGAARPLTAAALEAEIDPGHALTPAFRKERIAAAVFQHQLAARACR